MTSEPMNHCPQHPAVIAPWTCARCGRFFCPACGVPPQDGEGAQCQGCVALTAERYAEDVAGRSALAKLRDAGALLLLFPTRPMSSLERRGRPGSLVMVAAGAVALLPGLPMLVVGLLGSPRIFVLGVVATWFAASALFRGAQTLAHPHPLVRMTLEELATRLKYRPVVVCMNCQLVVSTIPCPICGSSADCLDVRSDDDEKMVLASVRG